MYVFSATTFVVK